MVSIVLNKRQNGYVIEADGKAYNFYIKEGLVPSPLIMKGISLIYAIGAFNPFPEEVVINWDEVAYLLEYICEMSKAMNQKIPTVVSKVEDGEPLQTINTKGNNILVAGSGGKDTLYILLKAIEQYGKEHVFPIHIKGITKSYTTTEEGAMRALCERLGLRLDVVTIVNSLPRAFTENPARNQVITGLLIPYLVHYNASNIAFGVPQDEQQPWQVKPYLFYETVAAEKLFSGFLDVLGYNVTMHRFIETEEGIYEYLVKDHEELLQLSTSCFQPDRFKAVRRGHNIKKYGFPLYETQCGLCEKCVRINTARLAFDDNIDASDYQLYIRVMLAYAKQELSKIDKAQSWSRQQWEWCIGHLEKLLKGTKLIQKADVYLDLDQSINITEDDDLW